MFVVVTTNGTIQAQSTSNHVRKCFSDSHGELNLFYKLFNPNQSFVLLRMIIDFQNGNLLIFGLNVSGAMNAVEHFLNLNIKKYAFSVNLSTSRLLLVRD